MQIRTLTLLAMALTGLPNVALGQPAEDFFKSASPSMIVGSGAGGGYDFIGRLVARHMSLPARSSDDGRQEHARSGWRAERELPL